jgi:hypothetical protein
MNNPYTYIYFDPSRDFEPFYVGKGNGRRYKRHLTRKDMHPMTHRIQKMLKENIEPIIKIIECSTDENALNLESALIRIFGRKDLNKGPLLNLTDGGENPPRLFGEDNGFYGKNHSDETKDKLRKARLGKKLSKEVVEKMALGHRGIPCSEAAIASTAKRFLIIFPDGHEEEIINMRKFCRENDLSYRNMKRVLRGERKQHKGFKAIKLS